MLRHFTGNFCLHLQGDWNILDGAEEIWKRECGKRIVKILLWHLLMKKWRYDSTHSKPRHEVEVSFHFHATDTLRLGKGVSAHRWIRGCVGCTFSITHIEDGWRKFAFLTRACFPCTINLTFRHRASCILGQAFHYSPENAFYIFNQQIYFIIWYLLDRASLI